jgi:hypothetical protein
MSMFRGNESSEIGHTIMAWITSMSKGETNLVYWSTIMVAYLVAKIETTPGVKSTFLAKRECCAFGSIRQVLPHKHVFCMWKLSKIF